MDLDEGTVEGDGLDLDAHDLLLLQLRKYAVEHSALGPAVHAGIDRVPVPESLGQATPLAPLLGNVEDRVENLQIRQADIAALARQTVGDALVLGFGDFHTRIVHQLCSLVLTRPRAHGVILPGQSPVAATVTLFTVNRPFARPNSTSATPPLGQQSG